MTAHNADNAIDRIVDAKQKSIGALEVGRVLPAPGCRTVGPYVFFDHVGPISLPAGEGLSVRPHPHIGLSTVTYLFEGAIDHRDSLGFHQTIKPGAVNWMTAGRGIVHSERSRPVDIDNVSRLHGIQLWVALPRHAEDIAPSFAHHPADAIPQKELDGIVIRTLVGEAFGMRSPVLALHPMIYVDVVLAAGSSLELGAEAPERGIYVVDGDVIISDSRVAPRQLAVLSSGTKVTIRTESPARVMVIGGAPLDGPRHVWWNLVSSSQERIEEAKRAWRNHEFPVVPGDEVERIPLPEN